MSIDETIASVVRLPRSFRMLDVSIFSLLQDSGYSDVSDQITLEAIREALRAEPSLLEEWLEYSESQRTGSGWYLTRKLEGFQVGRYTGDGKDIYSEEYPDGQTACASYILKELEDINSS